MLLKNNTVLKYLALLLFSFELLAPIYLAAQIKFPERCDKETLNEKSGTIILFSVLLSEEAGSEEERDGKEHVKIFFNLQRYSTKSLNYLSLLLGKISISRGFIQNPTATLERLYTLYQVFRI